jgi:pyrimidine-nucleoside phosphorylase
MRTVDLIAKKRNGHEHTKEEIDFLIAGYTKGNIPDYQLSAWAMAVYFQGMNAEETAYLTMAMVHSGDSIQPDAIPGMNVDKHSTGGVGDTTTLVLGPLVAAAGVSVAKMSGRGLGHTGGTIDKLEAISGFQVVIGQSGEMTPADKKLYALRDVTATVESIPLIAASIMSKKIASGAKAIVLDVKTGKGAFMKSLADAIELARAMVEIGTLTGRHTVAIISDMDQPLGEAVGNANEVAEAVRTLKGQGPADLTQLCLELGANMVLLGGQATDIQTAKEILRTCIADGSALAKLQQLVVAQGGDPAFIQDLEKLPQPKQIIPIHSHADGYIAEIQAEEIGLTAMLLGAGRETKDAKIDHSVGVNVYAKVGNRVKQGEILAELLVNASDTERLDEAKNRVNRAFRIQSEHVPQSKLIYAIVDANGVRYFNEA